MCLCLVVAVIFCTVVSAGCGGSSSSNNDNAPATEDEESGGRNRIEDDWDDLGFELLSGMWQVNSTEMILGNGVQLGSDTDLLPFIINATSARDLSFTSLFGQTARSIPATFTGQNTDGQPITADMTLVAGGTYTANNSSTYFQSIQGEDFVENYFIELSKSSAASAQYDIMTFTDMRAYTNQVASEQNYRLTTVLHKITEGNPDIPLGMAAGSWQIVSADLTEGVASQLTDSNKTGFFEFDASTINPNIMLTVSNGGVYWAPANGEFTVNALTGEFSWFERNNEDYSSSPYGVFRTSQIRDSNNQLDQEEVEFVGSSWNTIRYTHRHYNSAGTLEYRIRTILRRR